MNVREAKTVSRRLDSYRNSQSWKNHKGRRSNCETVGKKIVSEGQKTSGYVDENGKLLLEVQVTESLCADMSTTMCDNIIEEKGQVEVTIVRPMLAGISAGSIDNNDNTRAPDSLYHSVQEKTSNFRSLEKSSMKNSRSSKITAVPAVRNFSNHQRYDRASSSKNCSINSSKNDLKMKNHSKESNDEPLVELRALHKILDRLRPDDLESTSAWYSSEPCCREIVERFQNLLREWSSDLSRLDRALAHDRNLVKCDKCGVIRYTKETSQSGEKIVAKRLCNDVIAERENDKKLIDNTDDTLTLNKMKLLSNSKSVVSSRCRSEIARGEKISSKINRIPVSNRVLMKNTTTNDRFAEKSTIKNSTNKNDSGNYCENFKNSIAALKNSHDAIEKLAMMTAEKCNDHRHRTSFIEATDEGEKNLSLVQTIDYLTRGNFVTTEDAKSQAFSDKTTILEHPVFRDTSITRKHSFDLHGSRDVDFHWNSDFFSNDDTKHVNNMTKTRKKLREDTVILDNFDESRRSLNFSQHSDEKLKSHESSDTTSSFDSSSADNLIRRWMKNGCNVKRQVNEENKNIAVNESFPCEIPADPCLTNVQNIRAKIAEAIQKFANRWTISEQDLHGKSEYGDVNHSGSSEEASKNRLTQHPDKSHQKIDINTAIHRYEMGEQELRGISKKVSNEIWDERYNEHCVPVGVTDSIRVLSSMTEKQSISALTVESSKSSNYHRDLSIENSERFERQILYDQASSHIALARDDDLTGSAASKILLIYRKILDCNEEMDWDSFQQLVGALHPCQRELWFDICKAISNEAKRVADETGATTEVCIEINPRAACGDKKGIVTSRGDEITFELDMTLRDVRGIFQTNERKPVLVSSKET